MYCCRYEDALYVNRSHFIMLGMSWDAFNKLSREFPLLHDVEKQVLSPSLQLVADGALERRYAVRELLANREDACVVFSRARMDHVGGEDIMAASIYDDAAKRYPEAEVSQINILDREPLTELDVHIRSGFDIVEEELVMDDGQEEKWRQAFDICLSAFTCCPPSTGYAQRRSRDCRTMMLWISCPRTDSSCRRFRNCSEASSQAFR